MSVLTVFVQMEVFEVRERISDTDSAADLMGILSNIKSDIEQISSAFATSIDSANQARALHYAVRLRYYTKVRCHRYMKEMLNCMYSVDSFCVLIPYSIFVMFVFFLFLSL